MTVLILLIISFLLFIGLVGLLLARGLRTDTWAYDKQNVWKDIEVSEGAGQEKEKSAETK